MRPEHLAAAAFLLLWLSWLWRFQRTDIAGPLAYTMLTVAVVGVFVILVMSIVAVPRVPLP